MHKTCPSLGQRLPPEVLCSIAQLLDRSDIRSSLTVCRSWFEPFRRGLYRSVQIKDADTFRQFAMALQLSHERGLASFNLVRKIYLDHTLVLAKGELDRVINSLPNLTMISVIPAQAEAQGSWNYLHRLQVIQAGEDEIVDNDTPTEFTSLPGLCPAPNMTGACLTHLHLASKQASEVFLDDTLQSTLRQVPYLTNLVLGDESSQHLWGQQSFSVSHLHLLHSELKYLVHLRLLNFKLLWSNEIKVNALQAPATTIRTISFEDVSVYSHEWLRYWAFMYPNIQSLQLMFRQAGAEEMAGSARRAFLNMAKNFVNLQKYDISFYGSHIFGLRVLDISTIFQYNCTALEDINVFLPNSYQPGQIRDTTIYRYHNSLVKLQVALESEVLDHERILRPLLVSCSRLRDLSIGYYGSYGNDQPSKNLKRGIDIDTFLTYCPLLENLKVTNVELKLSGKVFATHGLRRLSMITSMTTKDVLESVKDMCPSLTKVHLKECIFKESASDCREVEISTAVKNSTKNDILQISDKSGLSIRYVPKTAVSYMSVLAFYKRYLQAQSLFSESPTRLVF